MSCLRTLLALMALVGCCWLAGCPRNDLDKVAFTPRVPDAAAVAKARQDDQAFLGDFKPEGACQSAVLALSQLNRMTVNAAQIELSTALDSTQRALDGCLKEPHGRDQVRRLCLWLLVQFEDGLRALLDQHAQGGPEALANGVMPPEAFRTPLDKFISTGGNFLPTAFANGLLEKSGDTLMLTEGAGFFIRLAFKVRFAGMLPEKEGPLQWLLNDFERTWYSIWVVERSKTAAMERRLAAIASLKSLDPAYPDQRARGIVLFRGQRYPEAVQAFQQGLQLHPDDGQLKEFLELAQERAKTH